MITISEKSILHHDDYLYVTTVNIILKKEKMPKQYVLRNTKKSRLNPKI